MSFQGDSIFWVEVNKVVPNPFQPRREFDEAKLKELADSIRMYGILQPLTVTKKEIHREDGAFYSEYELIAGERRLRASRLAGLEQVPVIIRSGEQTEQEKLELAIIENLQREDLNAVDRALAFKQLAEVFSLSHGDVAKKVGRSREYVSNSIRLLLLPEYMLSSLKTADISEGHARSLLMLKERPEEQDVVYREILLKKLSVREVERITRKIASDKVRKKNWANTDPVLIEIEREFTDSLGTRVQISKTDFGGKLTIDYFSDEDLHNLLTIVKSQGRMSQSPEDSAPDGMVSKPVMQAAGAAVMARLAQATPLEEVIDEPQIENSIPTSSPTPTEEVNEVKPTEPVSEMKQINTDSAHDAAEPASVSQPKPEQNRSQSPAPEMTPEPDDPYPKTTDLTGEVNSRQTVPPQPLDEKQVLPTQPEEDTKEDTKEDDNLYSIRNFSL